MTVAGVSDDGGVADVVKGGEVGGGDVAEVAFELGAGDAGGFGGEEAGAGDGGGVLAGGGTLGGGGVDYCYCFN